MRLGVRQGISTDNFKVINLPPEQQQQQSDNLAIFNKSCINEGLEQRLRRGGRRSY